MSVATTHTDAADHSSIGSPIMPVRGDADENDSEPVEDEKDSHRSGASVVGPARSIEIDDDEWHHMIAVGHALRNIIAAKNKYFTAGEYDMTDDDLYAVRSALKTQANMLLLSCSGLNLPLPSSYTGEPRSDIRTLPFTWDDAARYHSALVATRSDPETQRALRDSQTLLRNRFCHPSKMGDSRSHILQDMTFLLDSWYDHTADMRYYADRTERFYPALIKSGRSWSSEDQEKRAKKALSHKTCAMNSAKLYAGARKALESLVPDEVDCEGEGDHQTSA